MSKPQRSPAINQAQSISGQERDRSHSADDAAQGTYGQFEGPIQKSPFYKAMERTGVESTSNAYQGARSNMRARANRAGMGSADMPVTQGAESQMDSAEARSLADVPGKSLVAATGPALEAARGSAGIGASEGAIGADYWKSMIPLEQQYQDQMFQQQQAMWNSLAQIPKDLMGPGGD